jgi:hypothetical protein
MTAASFLALVRGRSTTLEQHDEYPGVRFRIDSNSLFVEFDQSVPVAEREGITKDLAAKLFDDSEVTVTIMPDKPSV